MQQNINETANRSGRSPEQQQTTNSLLRAKHNSRFAVTPETMGMNLPHEPLLVDVKPYCERHSKPQTIGLLSDIKQESNVSFHSSHSNTPKNSYASIKSENLSQQHSTSYSSCQKSDYVPQRSPSLSVSPKTPSQQWNFDSTIKTENFEPQNTNIYTSTALLSPTQSGHHIIRFPTGSNNLPTPKSCGDLHTFNAQPSTTATDATASRSQSSCGQNVTPTSEINFTSCYDQQLLKNRSGSDVCVGDGAKLNFKVLNDIFSKRIEHIDADVRGDKDLKIVTYQEWVEMLTKINESFITNMDELEREVAERLKLVQSKVNSNCRHSQGNELMKCRKDIDTLLKYIQNARNYNTWDLQGLTFETITPSQVLDIGDYDQLTMGGHGGDAQKHANDVEAMQRQKLFANMKALAHEVAEKHDEVRELKRQVICLEDEIQKAQKKIQLKDDVIKELRNDLKCANNKICANQYQDTSSAMPPINLEHQTSRSANSQLTDCNTLTDDYASQFDSLSQSEIEEKQKLKILEEEIQEFFEMNKELDKQKMENQRKRLMEIIQKLESDKSSAYRRLDLIRRQLIDLESDSSVECNNDSDSGFHSKNENVHDAKILDSVRRRLRKLIEMNGELKRKLQKLELENSELSNNLQSEKSFSQTNSETLKEVADLLCSVTNKQFSYTDIYSKSQNDMNPFCEAILEMKNNFKERECQLLKTVGVRNKELAELTQSLMQNEKEFNADRTTQWNESLKCQIAHLQRTVFEREQHIMELTSMLKNISQIQSTEPHQAALEYVTSRNNFAAELEKKIEKLTEKLDKSVRQEQFLHKETRKLNQELSESKRKNGDLISQAHRLGGLLKSQESHRMELAAKYETLEENYEDQAKKLRTANNQLCMLNERFQNMEKRQNEHNMERNLLREEVLSLKEKLACAMGRQKSLEEQLQKTEKELYNAHDVINEQKSIMQSKEISQNEAQRRCIETNTDLKRQLAELMQDYKKLQEEYDYSCTFQQSEGDY
ncbi:yuri gagarin isoform 2-T4 [Cochliomyia hominivorax]